ncbi:MAG: hypothetical protein IKJ13_07915 [Clostridia bacterium]|nr:hypothetical protein [Clostridia bacterium]
MKHIKSNSYEIVRLVINQVGISIFALVLYISMNIAGESSEELGFSLNLIASVFSILFYWALLYSVVWEIGAKDRIKIDSGKNENFPLKGALLSLVANVVNLVFAAVIIVGELVRVFAGSDAMNGIVALLIVAVRFTSAMFLRTVNAVCLPFGGEINILAQGVAYLIFFILTVGVCQLAYTLGMNNFKVFGNKQKNK